MDAKQHRSKGFTLIATLLLLLLLSGVALGLMYMVNTETRVGGNYLENGLAYHAAEGGMEKMTADLANLFSSSQAPNAGNIAALQAFPPTIPGVTYPEYTITPTNGTNPDGSFVSTTNTISSGNNKGLYAQLKFTRLVRRPGLKRSHSLHCKMTERRQARVYSKALVEANKKIC